MILLLQKKANETIKCDFRTIPKEYRDYFYRYIKEQKETKKKEESSLILEFTYFKNHFSSYAKKTDLRTFSNIDNHFLRGFTTYLSTYLTKHGTKLKRPTCRRIFSSLNFFIGWLARNYPDIAPPVALFKPNPFSRGETNNIKTKPIEDSILSQIKKLLSKEENPYIKACITIALYQGLRSEDILELKDDCLIEDPDNPGKFDIYYYNQKSDEWMKKRTFSSVVNAIKLLINHTNDLRIKSAEKNIFIHQIKGKVKRYHSSVPNRWINIFIKKNHIVNSSGDLIKINMHKLRTTLATNLDSSGVDVEIAAYQLDHKDSLTTMRYYIHSTDETYNKEMDVLDKIVSSTHIVNDINLVNDEVFQENTIGLRLDTGYCQDTKMIMDNEYICQYYTNRGNCYGCSKMVTTPEFLPYFEQLLKEKKDELTQNHKYGEHVTRQISFEINLISLLINKLNTISGEPI